MLIRLLQLMAEGGTSAHALAARLGVSEALVERMIEQLVALGYLQAVEPGCGEGACRGCPQAGGCAMQARARLWAVTEKGRRVLGREQA